MVCLMVSTFLMVSSQSNLVPTEYAILDAMQTNSILLYYYMAWLINFGIPWSDIL